MSTIPIPHENTRLGFHFFPDTLHYRATNLRAWLPELQSLGASWLTLQVPTDRAIPEFFLQGLIRRNIEPILQLDLPLDNSPDFEDLRLLFSTYARWGVNYIVLFDRPNCRTAWSSADWSQPSLVERFLDRYLPLAHLAHHSGLIPVYPPLEPGGDYWDTAFLTASIQAMKRRGHQQLLKNLVVGAHADAGHRSITWGHGGPERWPQTQPYNDHLDSEDQRGFHIFDWYIPIIENITKKPASIILFEAGVPLRLAKVAHRSDMDLNDHTMRNLSIAKAIASNNGKDLGNNFQNSSSTKLDPLPSQVIASNFWLLSADPDSPHLSNAWYKPDGTTLPIVEALTKFASDSSIAHKPRSKNKHLTAQGTDHYISHYLLLPSYDWGVTDWHLDLIKPFVKEYKPTVGFSIAEASLASRVTVVGGLQSFSESDLASLQAAGCIVERFSRDGTSIATEA